MNNLTSLLFTPYYQRQLPLEQLALSGVGAEARLSGHLQVNAKANQRIVSTSVNITFMGAQDVKHIHPSAIARIEPFNGCKEFEANFFPYIEFKDPDFLWRYSLDTSSIPRPWLTLIAISEQEMIKSESRLATIEKDQQLCLIIPRGADQLLPEMGNGDNPLSAHVQISPNPKLNPDQLHNHIQDHPENCCCRVFCMRKLEPRTHYHLFLVPSYQLKLIDQGKTELTVFFQSEFSTAQKGDFEFLARKIEPKSLTNSYGTRAVLCQEEGRELLMESALAAPGFTSGQRQAHTKYYSNGYGEDFINRLNAAVEINNDDDDPYIGLPYYGKMYQSTLPLTTVVRHSLTWSQEINVDRRNRVAASLGVGVVQDNQELYSQLAWQQVGDVLEANQIINRVYAGMLFNTSLENRYNKVLNEDRRLIRSALFHNQFKSQKLLAEKTLDQNISQTGLIPGTVQLAHLKHLHMSIGVEHLNLKYPWQLRGQTTNPRATSQINASDINKFLNTLKKDYPFLNRYIVVLGDRPTNAKSIFTPAPPVPTAPQFNFEEVFNLNINFERDALNKINHRISPPRTNFNPIATGPTINTPMYLPLAKQSLNHILPDIDKLDNNIITLCEENRYFIESYMLGNNHEMINKLSWQQFPIQPQASIFRKFWQSLQSEENYDIEKIQLWKNPLSQNQDRFAAPSLILLIKADLIRRYPEAIIYALRTNERIDPKITNQQPPEAIAPLFKANLRQDIVAYGFNLNVTEMETDAYEYYFVLEEPFSLPNFGLSLTRDPEEIAQGDIEFDHGNYLKVIQRTPVAINHSADFASAIFQRPVQMVQLASLMLNT